MQQLGFTKDWPYYNRESYGSPRPYGAKLEYASFTTFRWPRLDGRDMQVGQLVQVVMRPRSKERELLGLALVVSAEQIRLDNINDAMANEDGFEAGYKLRWWLKEDPRSKDSPLVWRYRLVWIIRQPHTKTARAWVDRYTDLTPYYPLALLPGGILRVASPAGATIADISITVLKGGTAIEKQSRAKTKGQSGPQAA
jgi:hypothetical protein